MLIKILNGVKAGHYFWMRRTVSVDSARSANKGIIFYTLFVYYGFLSTMGSWIYYAFWGTSFADDGIVINELEFFIPYVLIFFLFINPRLEKIIDDDIEELDKKMKKNIAKTYFIIAALLAASVGLISNLIIGVAVIR